MSLLTLNNLSVQFGGLTALKNVSLSVGKDEIVSVIGPNGAGKTTLFNLITGIYEPTNGVVIFNEKPLVKKLTLTQIFSAILLGAVSALIAILVWNIQTFWQNSIEALYSFGEPFPWKESLSALSGTFSAAEFNDLFLPAIFAFIVVTLATCVISFRGARSPDVICRSGIARTFQNIRLFSDLSVMDNVLSGLDRFSNCSFIECLFRLPRFFSSRKKLQLEAFEILNLVGLQDAAFERAGSLPYGSQRRLEIARALATNPKLLLLDEPAAGMNKTEAAELVELIRAVRSKGVSILLIEHHMDVVMDISDRIMVLDYGNPIASGTPKEVRSNPKVIEAYLGATHE